MLHLLKSIGRYPPSGDAEQLNLWARGLLLGRLGGTRRPKGTFPYLPTALWGIERGKVDAYFGVSGPAGRAAVGAAPVKRSAYR